MLIDPTEPLERAVGKHACQIAGAVEPTFTERIRDKTLRGFSIGIQVTARDLRPPHEQFTDIRHGHGFELRTQHVGGHIGQWPADRWSRARTIGEVIQPNRCDTHGRFRGAVVVDDDATSPDRLDSIDQFPRRGLAPQNQSPRGNQALGPLGRLKQCLQVRWNDLQEIDALGLDIVGQQRAAQRPVAQQHMQFATIAECREDCRMPEVGGKRRHRCVTSAERQIDELANGIHVVPKLALFNCDALGLTGRAGGVHHIGKIPGGADLRGIVCALLGRALTQYRPDAACANQLIAT